MSYFSSFNPALVTKASSNLSDSLTFALPLTESGPTNLSTNLNIDGTEIAPIFRYSSSGIRENIFGYTESFSGWQITGSLVQNAGPDPIGGNTATLLKAGVGASQSIEHRVRVGTPTGGLIPGELYTFSAYAKPASRRFVVLITEAYGFPKVYYDMQNGVYQKYGTTAEQDAIVDAGMEKERDGWWRVWFTHKQELSTDSYRITVGEKFNDPYTPQNGNGLIYIWGAQLNSGPLIPYYNAGATSAGPNRKWFADVGPDLDYLGSGNEILIKHSPFTDGAPIIKFNGGKYFGVSNFGAGPGIADTISEIVGFNDWDSNIALEWADTAAQPPRVEYNGSYLRLAQIDGSSVSQSGGGVRSSGSNGLIHTMDFIDTSDYTNASGYGSKSYSNGGADNFTYYYSGGNNANINMTANSTFAIGARINGGSPLNGSVILVAYYSGTDLWPGGASNLTTFQNIIKERSGEIMGVKASYAIGNKVAGTATRTSNNSFLDIQNKSGFTTLHQTAKGWMRVCRRLDGNNRLVSGYLSEGASTQQLDYTDNFSLWSGINSTLGSGYVLFTPHIDATVWSIIPNATVDNQYYATNTSVACSGEGWISFFVKAGVKTWCAVRASATSLSSWYFNLGTGTIGAANGADAVEGRIRYYGDGWYRVSMKYQNGTTGSVSIYPADGQNDVNFTPADTVTPLLHVCFPQVENGTQIPTSPIINSSTGTVTRAEDSLVFTDSTNFTNTGELTYRADTLADKGTVLSIRNVLEGRYNSNFKFSFRTLPLDDYNDFYSIGYDDAAALSWNHSAGNNILCDGYFHVLKQSAEYSDHRSYFDYTEDQTDIRSYYPASIIDGLYIGKAFSAGHLEGLVSNIRIYNKVKHE